MCQLSIRQISPSDWIAAWNQQENAPSFALLDAWMSDVCHPLKEWVAGDDSVLLHIPAGATAETIEAWFDLRYKESNMEAQLHSIPVMFDGPDLAEVAAWFKLSEQAYIERVCAGALQVKFMGFAPGFGYMTGLDEAGIPRRSNPRKRMQAGAVAVAAGYASIYPIASPGGWNWIGNTELELVDIERESFLFAPGDRVKFVEV